MPILVIDTSHMIRQRDYIRWENEDTSDLKKQVSTIVFELIMEQATPAWKTVVAIPL